VVETTRFRAYQSRGSVFVKHTHRLRIRSFEDHVRESADTANTGELIISNARITTMDNDFPESACSCNASNRSRDRRDPFAGMTNLMRMRCGLLTLLLLFSALASGVAAVAPAYADEPGNGALPAPLPVGTVVPPGTQVRFHLDTALSSGQNKTGERFSFTLLEPITVDSRVLVPAGAQGVGTVFLAGHAGSSGHEGDLTLRLGSVRTPDGNRLAFADQRVEINGRNRKAASHLLGLIPFAGMGARFIRGGESRVDPDRPIETVLKNAATVEAGSEDPSPTPSASPASPGL
jgi:hypothetical protein